MPLKLTCPHCGHPARLTEPYPLPGSRLQCAGCGSGLAVTYPDGVVEQLRSRGRMFQTEDQAATPRAGQRAGRSVPHAAAPPPPSAAPKPHVAASKAAPKVDRPTEAPTMVDPTVVQAHDPDAYFDRTVPSARSPYGNLPGNAPEPEGSMAALPSDGDPTEASVDEEPIPVVAAPKKTVRKKEVAETSNTEYARKAPRAVAKAPPAARSRVGCIARLALLGGVALMGCFVVGSAAAAGGYFYYASQLPTVEALQAYKPPTVTMVYDHEGKLLGEIYEQRRYVVPLEQIPKHVQDAFIASEDAAFWTHGGVDYLGLARAVGNEVFSLGSKSQGASTITMQVTRNFLLTRDKTYERKIKEIILSWRIEDTYDKDHILYLYLNEIYLGSGAYGVEAASRVYFDKHVEELTVAEAAILAGLPQRPSDYSPHQNWTSAKDRQGYVLDQMVRNGYLTKAESDAAAAEEVKIVERTNEFLYTAPHFTEYVRRYIVDTYGHDKVYNEGLTVTTTCDLELQTLAQKAVTDGVTEVDQRVGFRRVGLETLADDTAIAARRAEMEQAMKEAWAEAEDPAGRVPLPEKSTLVPGQTYDGILLEVSSKWARVAIGSHEGIIPLAWSTWVYDPDPRRSWRYRDQTDLTEKVDIDDDGKKEGSILRKGDVVLVKIEGLSTKDAAVSKAFANTPGATEDLVAVKLWQKPEVEGALLSFDLETAAVRAMVGGADFETSEFNRAIQARRQVGSTFKPIVYAAALDSRKITTATMVTDGPLAYSTDQEFIWKPANYGDDYLGNVTLRKALALSRNTCTVRVLDAIDPGMNDDIVYKFARSLGIGGPPTAELPADWAVTPETDVLCPWTLEKKDSTICMDHWPPRTDPESTNTKHRSLLTATDQHWCRSCDLSMGLGSASLTMEEITRAYSAFPTGGKLLKPYYIEEVKDRNGNVLEQHVPETFPQVMDPGVASITTWLLEGVVDEGTASAANKLGINVAGKTGTTNDEKDAWFVGFSNDVITSVWVGYDTPRPLGLSSTGGRTSLPIWMAYMAVAAPKELDRPFPMRGDIEWAQIEETNGRRVDSGGRAYPFLTGTAPQSSGIAAGQLTLEDLSTEL